MEVAVVKSASKADADGVIVTLFRCDAGKVRGWYEAPSPELPEIPIAWRSSASENLSGPTALMRAWEIADRLKRPLTVIDPDNLWGELIA